MLTQLIRADLGCLQYLLLRVHVRHARQSGVNRNVSESVRRASESILGASEPVRG